MGANGIIQINLVAMTKVRQKTIDYLKSNGND
jgi:hypothetical protein